MAKLSVLIVAAVISLVAGFLAVALQPGQPFGSVNLGMMLVGSILLFMWFRIDAIERRYERSNLLNVAVVGFPFLAFPYYLFRTRGFSRGVLATLVYLAACVGSAVLGVVGGGLAHTLPIDNAGHVISATVTFLEEDHRSPRRAIPVSDFRIAFPLIGGSLFGKPTTQLLFAPEVDTRYSFTIDLRNANPQVISALQEHTDGADDLIIRPRETKFARVATFTLDPTMSHRVGFTGWLDGETRERLILAYFDRACTLKGRLSEADQQYRYDVVIPIDGYTWLRFRKIDEHTTDVVPTSKPTKLLLSVTPLKVST